MKKAFCCLLGISLLASCGAKPAEIDKVYEDGVEVVLNHVRPYRVPDEGSELILEKVYMIDTESPNQL